MLKKVFILSALFCFIGAGIGCKSDSSSAAPSTSLTGTVATGSALQSTVYIKGANGKVVSGVTAVTSDSATNGKYTIIVNGLTPPYIILAQNTALNINIYSVAYKDGTANVTPATNAIVALIFKQDPKVVFPSAEMIIETTAISELASVDEIKGKMTDANVMLQTILAPVLAAIPGADTTPDFLGSAFDANGSGLDSLLDVIKVDVTGTAISFNFNGSAICTVDPSSVTIDADITAAAGLITAQATDIGLTIIHDNTAAGNSRAQEGIDGISTLMEHFLYTDAPANTVERDIKAAR